MKFFYVIALVVAGYAFMPAETGRQRMGKPAMSFNTKKELAIGSLMHDFKISEVVNGRVAMEGIAGFSRNGRPIRAFYFPGTGDKRAMIIGGVHGSELSAIEVAKTLIEQLGRNEAIYYSVIVIPCLFPDNANHAASKPMEIGSVSNIGRYSYEASADPNRQMPALGKPFDKGRPFDFAGRPIEPENQLLLQFIQEFRPLRIVNIHGIRSPNHAGIYADPRTDSRGYALEYASDSTLAINMAMYIESNGGRAPGNRINNRPSALYHADPPVAQPGQKQSRNLHGSRLPGNRGFGVSLGSWASTAVNDPFNSRFNRPGIRLFTMEFPGNKRPVDYTDPSAHQGCRKNVELYAGSILKIFLSNTSEEE